MKINDLNHVAIQVLDVEKSIRFYEDVVGLKQLRRPAFDFPGAWFRLGKNQELHLIGIRTEPVFSGSRSNHFAFKVEGLPEYEEQLRKINFPYRPAKQRVDGALHLFLIDPDGHWIELVDFGKSNVFSKYLKVLKSKFSS